MMLTPERAIDLAKEPVSAVRWMHRDQLLPNDYNPNRVAPAELELLIISILEDGWTQPIVALNDGTIVDGFHRFFVSADQRLFARYRGMVPVVVIEVDPVHRKMSTIRHNRARGTHAVLRMAAIVRAMIDDGIAVEEIERRLGMEDEEVVRLNDRAGMPAKSPAGFGKGWIPDL
jgi:ParB-like chromosome segregation protein Spo0J